MRKKKPRNENNIIHGILISLILIMIVATLYVVKCCLDIASIGTENGGELPTVTQQRNEYDSDVETELPTETTMPVPEHVVATATVGAMGDLLMHEPIFDDQKKYNAAVQQADGSYDFESVFRYLAEYTTALDYAVANLETTLCGEDNGYAYGGYPLFNCPDEIVDGVKDAGFDMLLTANNHSYDTSLVGYKRTLEVIRERGMETLGTYASADERKWSIQNINGIQVGMLCYTWASGVTNDGRPSLNGNMAISEVGICNYFYSGNLPSFYGEVESYLEEMSNAGAEATIMYIHWGQEYMLTPNTEQQTIAQKLCDLGIDVIIGGHPHVVQPIDLLESTINPDHKTVCLYSMGNAVSNQRKGLLSSIKTAHTEDGILFSATFEKYSDGTVYLAEIDALPTWVNMHTNSNGKTEYNILPLDYGRLNEWQHLFDIGDTTYEAAQDSYKRTMEIVGDGLSEVRSYLAQEKTEREAYYLSLIATS